MTISDIEGPAGSLRVEDGGRGAPTVLFLHGFGGSLDHWRAQLDHVRSSARAIGFDLRGHGASEPPRDGDYAVESQVSDAIAVLDAVGVERAVLVGHSLGGAIAIATAAAWPDRVDGLVLVAAPGDVPRDQAEQIIASMEADYEQSAEGYWKLLTANADPDVLRRIRRDAARIDSATGLAIIKATFAFDPVAPLRAYRGPRLAVVTPRGDSPHDLHNVVPGIRHEVISGTSHFLQMDRPDDVNRILDEFLAEVRSGAPVAGG